MKTQIVINAHTLEILSTRFAHGKTHDFRLYQESNLLLSKETLIKGDSGYQGIQERHQNSTTPYKRKRHTSLSKAEKQRSREAEKQHNHSLSSKRIFVEHVIGRLKRFKVISERYRNRRKRFGLRFNLIAGVYNSEL